MWLLLGWLWIGFSWAAGPASYTSQDQCTEIDFRPKLPPIRNQDSVGWCYAYTAADLLSFHSGKSLSATSLAVNYNHSLYGLGLFSWLRADKPESQRNGGDSVLALKLGLKNGVCLEENFPSIDYSATVGAGKWMNRLKNLEWAAWRSNIGKARSSAQKDHELNTAIVACSYLKYATDLFPGIDFEDFRKVLAVSSQNDIVENLEKVACKKKVEFENPPKAHISTCEEGTEHGQCMAAEMKKTIEQGIPLGFGYDSKILFNMNVTPGKATHGSVLVGRRWNSPEGRCEYLVRNSWGTTCSYSPYYDCEEGNIWIPEGVIARATEYFTYLQ